MNEHGPFDFERAEDYDAASGVIWVDPMTPNPQVGWLYVAMIVNSALYLACVFTAGLVHGDQGAWILALATMGACYFAPMLQILWPRPSVGQNILIFVLFAWSIVLGIAAGVALFV